MKQFLHLFLGLIIISITFSEVKAQLNYRMAVTSLANYPVLNTPDSTLSTPTENDDNIFSTINLPFPFTFNQVTYNQITPNTNGILYWGEVALSNINLSPTSEGIQQFSGLNSDLLAGTISVATTGSAPDRTFIIQYSQFLFFGTEGNLNFQVRLHETVNTIEVIYGSIIAGTDDNYINVGFAGTNSREQQLVGSSDDTNPWTSGILLNSTNSSLPITAEFIPNEGLVYTFTPPPPSQRDLAIMSFIDFPEQYSNFCDSSEFSSLKVVVTNRGLQSAVNPSVRIFVLDNQSNIIASNIITSTRTLAHTTSDTLNIPTFLLQNLGRYSVIALVNSTDENSFNDTIVSDINVNRTCSRIAYTQSTSNSAYIPLTNPTIISYPFESTNNGRPRVVTLPFGFNYYGQNVGFVAIDNNGFVSLTGYSQTYSDNILQQGIRILAPFCTSLVPGSSGSVSYETVGQIPNRAFVIQYKNMIGFNESSGTMDSTVLYNFQIRLNENQTIEYVFGNMQLATLSGAMPVQLGLSGNVNTAFNQYVPVNAINWSSIQLASSYNPSLYVTRNVVISTGTRYTFTPPIFYDRDLVINGFYGFASSGAYCTNSINQIGVIITNGGRQSLANPSVNLVVSNNNGDAVYFNNLRSTRTLSTFQSDTLFAQVSSAFNTIGDYRLTVRSNSTDENRFNDSIVNNLSISTNCTRPNFVLTKSNDSFQEIAPDSILANVSQSNIDGYEVVTLPFNFPYNGYSVNSLQVFHSGFVSFQQLDNYGIFNRPLQFPYIISPLGCNLSFGTSSQLGIKTIGIAPNRTVIVEWKNMIAGLYSTYDSSSILTFQMHLLENGTIKYVYDRISMPNYTVSTQVGLNTASINDFIVMSLPNNTRSLDNLQESRIANDVSVTINQQTTITSGLTLTFTPPNRPDNDVALEGLGFLSRYITICDSSSIDSLLIAVRNLGINPVSNINYVVEIKRRNGTLVQSIPFQSNSTLQFGQSEFLQVPSFILTEAGEYLVSARITTPDNNPANDSLNNGVLTINNCGLAPYTFTSSVTPYVPLANGTYVNYFYGASEGYAQLPLPNPFIFNGVRYNSVHVHVNGFLSFGRGYAFTGSDNLIDTENYPNLVLALNANLNCIGYTTTYGTDAATNDFVIEFSSFIDGTSNVAKFQYRLTADNSIIIKYDTVNSDNLTTITSVYSGLKIDYYQRSILSNASSSWLSPDLTTDRTATMAISNAPNESITHGLTHKWATNVAPISDLALEGLVDFASPLCGAFNNRLYAILRNEGSDTINTSNILVSIQRVDSSSSQEYTVSSTRLINPNDTIQVNLGVVNLTNAGNYSIRTTAFNANDANLSNNSVVNSITVRNTINTVPVITTSTNTQICQGASVVLTAPNAPFYLWSTGQTTPNITAYNEGSYTVRIANNSNCFSDSSLPIVVSFLPQQPQPTISANRLPIFCNGTPINITLTSSSVTNNLWSNGETTQSITVTSPGTYYVVTTAIGGLCSSQRSNEIRVSSSGIIPQPVILLGGNTTFCGGQGIFLSAPAATSYGWSNGDTTRTIYVTESGNYKVAITNEGGCVSDSSLPVLITVFPAPAAPVLTLIGNSTFCSGDSVVLQGPANAGEYLWSNGAISQSITVRFTGTYSLRTRDVGIACFSNPSLEVNTIAEGFQLAPTIYSSNDFSFCFGDSTILSCYDAGRKLWSTGDTTDEITVRNSGTYSVRIITDAGCSSDVSEPVLITTINLPDAPSITYFNGSLQASGNFTLYIWYKDSVEIVGEDQPILVPTEDGIYQAQGISDICTSAIGAGIAFTTASSSSLSQISIFPNPSKKMISVKGLSSSSHATQFILYSTLGNKVLEESISLQNGIAPSIDISSLPTGMYQYKIISPEGQKSGKLIIQ